MSSVHPQTAHLPEHETLTPPGTRLALSGFFVSGILLAFLGAILPSWQHHLQSDFLAVGSYFIAMVAGELAAVWAAPKLLHNKGLQFTLVGSCAVACGALMMLAFFSPPFAAWWRLPEIFLIGASAGVLHTAIFHAVSPLYRHDPAATVNLAGIFFGVGCMAVAFVISRLFYAYTVPAIQIWVALIPGIFAVAYARSRMSNPAERHAPAPHAVLSELKSPGAVLLSLLLFFQMGNEWAIAGWLALYLSQRIGMSPPAAIFTLAVYWTALLFGRIAAQWMMPRARHTRMLMASSGISMFACVILLNTDNQFGAISGVILLGGSFAPVYPLVVERIGQRFPDYHPGFYNGIFSFALAGGLLAPCTLGYFAWLIDIRAVMGLPLLGSVMILILLALIWIESRLSPSARVSTDVS